MKITIQTAILKKMAEAAASIIPSRVTAPIQDQLLFETDGSLLRIISVTESNMLRVGPALQQKQSTLVDATILLKGLRAFQSESVTISFNSRGVTLTALPTVLTIPSFDDPANFPSLDRFSQEDFTPFNGALRDAIHSAIPFTLQNEQHSLSCVCIDPTGVYACNHSTMLRFNTPTFTANPILVPRQNAAVMAKMLPSNGMVAVSERAVYFKAQDLEMSLSLFNAPAPGFSAKMTQALGESSLVGWANTKLLRATAERFSLLFDSTDLLDVSKTASGLALSCHSHMFGTEASDVVPLELNAEDTTVELSYNPQIFARAVAAMQGPTTTIGLFSSGLALQGENIDIIVMKYLRGK